MRAVVQRISRASVTVEGEVIGAIGPGLLVLLGSGDGDTEEEARWLAHKVANLRIFADTQGKMNLSVQDIGGKVLVVSQFTLYANTRKGFRPSFVPAAPPEVAEPLVDLFVEAVRAENVPVQTGVFGAHMMVELINDGPVTIILEKEAPEDA
jgi:D-tyrosyl-tRNA(Tyr) deacylase